LFFDNLSALFSPFFLGTASTQPDLVPADEKERARTGTPSRSNSFEIGEIYSVIPGRLGFSVHQSDEHTHKQIADYPKIFFFSSDSQERYEPFCGDFGPVNLGVVHDFCGKIRERMEDPRLRRTMLVYYSEEDPNFFTNTVFLLAAYLVVEHEYTAEQAWAEFGWIDNLPVLPFRDATYCKQDYELTVLNCLQGLQKAIDIGWYDKNTFDADQYKLLDDPENADMHFLSPDFVAFKGPSARKKKLMDGVYTMTPGHYSSIFSNLEVTDVVRLNEPNTYDKQKFVDRGIRHHDLYFDDCTVPSNSIALKFLTLAETIIGNGGRLAVHCKAGLGRTGTLIALYWMKHHGFTAEECIGWQRIVRPGCILGPQQQYLHWAEQQLRVTKTSRMTQPDLKDEPRQVMSAEESARLGLEVAAAQNLRSGQRANADRET